MPVMNGYEATKVIRNFENKEIANIQMPLKKIKEMHLKQE